MMGKPVVDESKFVTCMYYGRVSVTSFDSEMTGHVANVIADALKAANISCPVSVLWIYNEDGKENVDSTWNGTRWVKPAKRK